MGSGVVDFLGNVLRNHRCLQTCCEKKLDGLAKEQQRTSGALRYLIRYINPMSITLEEEAYSIVEKRLSL
jgi:hypothetical protein